MSRADPGAAGTIRAAHGRQFVVRTDNGQTLVCVMRGKRNDAAVNDRVAVQATGSGGGVIEAVLPRQSLLRRADNRRTKLFAANLDQVAVVIAPDPPASEELLLRAGIAAHESDLPVALLMNKADLLAPDSPLHARLALHESLGMRVFRVAAKGDPEGTRDALLPWLRARTTLFIGQSGMGKSTLINLLVPDAELATQTISAALATGRHTTTFAKAFDLPEGGTIIDSPGFQEFGLGHLSLSQVQAGVPELAERAGQCRFHNCTHRQEPGCAVLDAVRQGGIDARRWRIYADIADEVERRPAY